MIQLVNFRKNNSSYIILTIPNLSHVYIFDTGALGIGVIGAGVYSSKS